MRHARADGRPTWRAVVCHGLTPNNPRMKTADPFALLGLARSFAIDAKQVQRAYLKRVSSLHPDRETDPIRQAEVAREAAAVNDARRTLLDDEARANTLLDLLGGPAKEDDKSLPDGFLMEMMEVREDMEQAIASGEEAERARVMDWAAEQRAGHIARLTPLFASAAEQPTDEVLAEIRRELNAWRYIERMIEQLDPAYDGLAG